MLDELDVGSARDRLLILRAIPNLSGLDAEGFELLAAHTVEHWVEKGEVILRENEPIERAYLVASGMILCKRGGYVTARVDRGGVGFLSVLARDPAGIEAVATEPSHVLSIPTDMIFDVYEENFSFLRNAIRLLARGVLGKRDNLPRRADEGSEVETGEWFDRPKTLVEKIIAASSGGILATANLDAVIEWARATKEIRAEPGDVLWRIGDPGVSSLYIQYGKVRCSTDDGRSTVVGKDFVLGALDPMCERARAYEAVADTKVIGLRLNVDEWMAVVETHRDLGLNLLKVLATALLRLQLEDAKREATEQARAAG